MSWQFGRLADWGSGPLTICLQVNPTPCSSLSPCPVALYPFPCCLFTTRLSSAQTELTEHTEQDQEQEQEQYKQHIPSLSSPFPPLRNPKRGTDLDQPRGISPDSDESGITSGVQGLCFVSLTVFVTRLFTHHLDIGRADERYIHPVQYEYPSDPLFFPFLDLKSQISHFLNH